MTLRPSDTWAFFYEKRSENMNKNIIINGNCLNEMNKIESNSIDLIFADPPYYMRTTGKLIRPNGTPFQGCNDEWDKFETLEEYKRFTYQWLSACHRIIKPNGSIWIIGGMQWCDSLGSEKLLP